SFCSRHSSAPSSPWGSPGFCSSSRTKRRPFSASSVGMSPPGHRLPDAEGALLDEISILTRSDGPDVPIKDLELRLEDRGFTDIQTRRALVSLLRRGAVLLSAAETRVCERRA